MPFKDVDDELIRRANDSVYGLVAGIWTANMKRAHRTLHCRSEGTSNRAEDGKRAMMTEAQPAGARVPQLPMPD